MMLCHTEFAVRKWFSHFYPLATVASCQDLKDELTLGGELTITAQRCIQRMLSAKKMKMYRGWLASWKVFSDPCFVV